MREYAVSTHEPYWQMQYQKMMSTRNQKGCQKASFVKLKVRVKEEPVEEKKKTQLSYGNLYEKPRSAPSSWAGPVPASVFAAMPKSKAVKCLRSRSPSSSSYSSKYTTASRPRIQECCGNLNAKLDASPASTAASTSEAKKRTRPIYSPISTSSSSRPAPTSNYLRLRGARPKFKAKRSKPG